MNDQEAFVRLSCTLTGLSETEIPAKVDQRDVTGATVQLAGLYLQRLRAAYPAEFGELLSLWRGIQLDPNSANRLSESLANEDESGLRLRIAARQVIKIWYLSTIDDPWSPLSKEKGKEGTSTKQLGGDLGQFENSAVWKLIGAPVQGYSTLSHGYWVNKPDI